MTQQDANETWEPWRNPRGSRWGMERGAIVLEVREAIDPAGTAFALTEEWNADHDAAQKLEIAREALERIKANGPIGGDWIAAGALALINKGLGTGEAGV